MTTKLASVTDEVANIVRQHLEQKFGDTIVFDPIEVIPKVDHDGDEYLHIYIVYDCDYELLDTAWTLGFYELIQPKLAELGVESIPSKSFVEKSDWEEVYGSSSSLSESSEAMKKSSHHKPVRDENSKRSLREDHRDKRSLEQIIEDSFKGVPKEEWDKLPHDLTDRLDYYLYGTER